ncbi:transcription-repair coupling factor [Rubrimonas cliftonensis]|uniref:Transcription-repair-coupling factor n=1 Tax=Rubrimonas cliftonensis TaxID=89524 RepID=A0A1H4DKR3_9RHOB|nr:transcription-repair coupling factor [Rubrimonas cliftonensis]SEA73294.1 transcription-repair coupling factor [Rubrimonas cliftonensis]
MADAPTLHAARKPLRAGAVTVGGAPEGFDATLVADIAARAGGPVLHIARDDRRMAAMADALAVLAPSTPVLRFPAWDCLPYDRVSPAPEIAAARMATLARLARLARGVEGAAVVLTTVNAAVQRTPARETVLASSFEAQVGARVDVDALMGYLGRMGYNRAATVSEPGDFAVRGGIVDIFPPGAKLPVRLDFFGDTLDGARRFEVETQRTVRKVRGVSLAPASEIILDPESIARFRTRYRETFGAAALDDALYAAVSAGRKHQGVEHWAPLFHDRMATPFDFLPGAPVTMDHLAEEARDARLEMVRDHHDSRADAPKPKGGVAAPSYKPLPPEALHLTAEEWAGALDGRPVRRFDPNRRPPGPGIVDAGGRMGREFAAERRMEGVNLFDALADHVKARRREGAVVIASWSEGARDRLATLLADHGVKGAKPVDAWAEAVDGAVSLMVWPLERGFETARLTVISEQDVLGDRLVRGARRKRAENVLTEAAALSIGDLVVHVEHGIGRYTGLVTIEAMGAPHECLALEYAGASKLYLPVENIELLTRYGDGAEAQLDRLGGGAWQARKAKLKERLRDIADRLIRVAAERAMRKGALMTPPPGAWDEFCARFPYEETDDQLRAIADVLDDLASGRPMDRLICGDVGFGKTEVALRAAYVAAMSGAQVAVVCPTTLLARQHAKGFAERFHGAPLTVRQLSRFTPAREAAETRKGLETGDVNIVIGTHALLAKGIKFSDLGLLIIDEEQHFGVQHKERLKTLKADVHVLTMTATPIPRTLQLAMTGVRELSLIATPPVDRLAVRTYVTPWDPVTVREALLRERYRGGQAFYVAPRISDLPEIEQFLKDSVPEVSFVTAHGQLAAGELDRRMNAFYDGEYDVLLATTIIESGIDIPAANTLIVHRADMFGLAQMYQIRGRVGRSKARAYAYFTTPPRKPLADGAVKRLKVLSSLDTLGAGFTLASHDLDIRGAGNLLGEEQSGHVREVGFELYQDMLEETIARMRAGEIEGLAEVEDAWAPQINLGAPVLIPEGYVSDLDVRLGLYRRLSALETRAELEGFGAELYDRFGKPPEEVETLLRIVRIKTLCRKAGVAKLDGGPKGATIQFRGDRFADPAALVAFIQDQKGLAKVKDNRLVVRRDWPTPEDRVKGAFAIMRDLAKLVRTEAKAA